MRLICISAFIFSLVIDRAALGSSSVSERGNALESAPAIRKGRNGKILPEEGGVKSKRGMYEELQEKMGDYCPAGFINFRLRIPSSEEGNPEEDEGASEEDSEYRDGESDEGSPQKLQAPKSRNTARRDRAGEHGSLPCGARKGEENGKNEGEERRRANGQTSRANARGVFGTGQALQASRGIMLLLAFENHEG
ncbi:hypothetical protein TRVL_06571 [Trypanosoma vivax]|uniref:Uncharacterized protein n=1 Tax=Trypanosoma vivax (strain Y486) TaxID=1055687 RepID=G0TYX4_TRYVY|nr:hypothetical protein TRVL_06571 [Trypanosoma vivax]CCC49177.1 hypothetical protein, unlikely [Trypanosoma vivax Y486]